jgi:threonine dehydrogenase-like Zn-dependent dehydrogenase
MSQDSMKVLNLYGPKDLRLETRPIPHPGPGQLVMRVDLVGVCGSDIEFFEGHIPPFLKLPFIPGHEVVGTVVELGEGVTEYKVGDRIIGGTANLCKDLCQSCAEGKPNICMTAFPEHVPGFGGYDGAYAEYLLVHEMNQPVLIPDGVDFMDAVLFDVICVPLHGIKISRFKIGDNVVVSGAGSIGLPCIQFLRAAGASKIIALDVLDENEAPARQYGADYFVNAAKSPDVAAEVREIVGSKSGADIVYECAGQAGSFMNAIDIVKLGGQIVCIGCVAQEFPIMPGAFHPKEIDFQFSFTFPKAVVKAWMDLMAMKRVSFPGMVTGVFSMENVVEDYMDLPSRKGHIKGVIDPRL